MKILFSRHSWEDYNSWRINDKNVLLKINRLITEIQQDTDHGSGKYVSLKFDLNGLYSRRIEREHRLVYRIVGNELLIYSCRFHYDK